MISMYQRLDMMKGKQYRQFLCMTKIVLFAGVFMRIHVYIEEGPPKGRPVPWKSRPNSYADNC